MNRQLEISDRDWNKTQDIVDLFKKHHMKVNQVAQLLGVSRQAIWKRLRKVGVRSRDFVWIDFVCAFCGEAGRRRWRRVSKAIDSYCNTECYFADLENPGYKQWRQGSRIGRAIVAQYYGVLPEGAIVHHRDGDDRNNDRSNLMLLASQADHMRIHRGNGGNVEVLWDGSE